MFLTAAQKTILPFREFSNCDPAVTTINSKITPLGANQTVGFQVDGKYIIISMHRMKSMAAMCHYCRENSYLLYYTLLFENFLQSHWLKTAVGFYQRWLKFLR